MNMEHRTQGRFTGQHQTGQKEALLKASENADAIKEHKPSNKRDD